MAFTVPFDQVALRVQADLEAKARARMHKLFTRIVMRTPVDTGRTQANWNVSQGTPNYTFTEATNLSRAIAEVDKVKTMPMGAKVFLANGAPHIRLLEYGGYPLVPKHPTGKTSGGFSTQAPAGMVRISVIEFGGKVE